MQFQWKRHALMALFVATFGCDSEHPSRATATGVLDAWVYGDFNGIANAHVAGTQASEYCSQTFVGVLENERKKLTQERCDAIGAINAETATELPDEARLLVQIQRTLCEDKQATCVSYATKLLQSQFETTPRPTKYELKKVMGDESTAVVYVDLTTTSGVEHRVIQMKPIDGKWRVTQGLFSEQK